MCRVLAIVGTDSVFCFSVVSVNLVFTYECKSDPSYTGFEMVFDYRFDNSDVSTKILR